MKETIKQQLSRLFKKDTDWKIRQDGRPPTAAKVDTTGLTEPTHIMSMEALRQVSEAEPMSAERAKGWLDRAKEQDCTLQLLPGRVVSPEIDQEQHRFMGLSMSTMEENTVLKESLLAKIMSRKGGKLELPEGTNVEQILIDSGHYKLGTGPHHVTQVKPKIEEAVHVRIQNVADYFIEHYEEHKWNEIKSFTCAKMPFPKIMFSYDSSTRKTKKPILRHMNVGLAACSTEAFLAKAAEYKININDVLTEIRLLAPDCWIEARVAIDGRTFPGLWFVAIDKAGQVLTDDPSHFGWFWLRDPRDTQVVQESEYADELEAAICRHGSIALAAVQFMNCRNVEILENPPTRQQRRQAERENRPPAVTYKTLVIHPMGQKRRVVRQADGTAVPGVSLHIVRGHLKRYTEGKGLGRAHVHGVWWWSPNVRGNREKGRVEKDYSIDVEG